MSLLSLGKESDFEGLFHKIDYTEYQNNPVGFGEQVLKDEYTDDIKILMNSVLDFPVTLAKSANATGKTHCAARIALWAYKVFPNVQVYLAAAPPEENLKRLLWGELASVVQKHPEIFGSDTQSGLSISRTPQDFIAGVSIPASGTSAQRQAKFSGKHSPHLLFILDEADAIPAEVFSGIESCLSGGWGRLLMMFNPRSEFGEAYRMERDGTANVVNLSAFNHPNVVTGEDKIPGAVTRKKTVQRINEWTRPLNPDEGNNNCFELPYFLVGAVCTSNRGIEYSPLKAGFYKIKDPAFSHMVLGEYPAQGTNQLISKEWINLARSRWDVYVSKFGELPPEGIQPIQGQDVAEFGSDFNVSCFRYGGWVSRLHRWNGVDPLVTGDKASALYKVYNAYCVNVDATGVGAGVVPAMQRLGCNTFRVMVASSPTRKTEMGEFTLLNDQLAWGVREWLRTDQSAMLPPEEELLEELAVPTYEIVKGKIKVMGKDEMKTHLKRSPDSFDALKLTFYETLMKETTLAIEGINNIQQAESDLW